MTANNHNGRTYGCFDSLYFKTNDGVSFGCNARTDTNAFPTNSAGITGTNPTVFTLPADNELAKIELRAQDDCMTGYIRVWYKPDPCASNDVSAIKLAMKKINGKK